MTWRTIVISRRSKLDLRLNYLVIRGEAIKKVHLSEISNLIIESTEVSLTAALLAELIKQKVKVIFCDEKRNPCSELLPYYGCHDTSSKVREQIKWKDEVKHLIWTEIVRSKINNQMDVLIKYNLPERVMLSNYLKNVEFNDATNREAHAAKVYFNALFGQDFSRADDNLINSALNYGYGIILSITNREIVNNGYITQLGIFHDNVFNQFNLGSDLMEPFRPFIDDRVYSMWKKGKLNKFEHDEKMEILSVINTEVLQELKKQILNNAIRNYCKSIFEAIREKDISIIKNSSMIESEDEL